MRYLGVHKKMEALMRAYDEGNLEQYLALQPLSVKKAIKRMM